MKEKLFNELKAKGLIPDTLSVESVTEEYLLTLCNNSSLSGNPTPMTPDDMKKLVADALALQIKELGIDKIDAKYMKLPGVDIPESELAGLSADQIKRKKMLKFVQNAYKDGGTFAISEGNTLALNTEGTTTTGGFTVPIEFIPELSKLLYQYGVFRRNARYRKMNSMTATMPKLNAAPAGAFVNETAAKPESNPTFTQITFTRHDYAFITGLSKQLLQDTGIDLVSELATLAANDFAKTEDTQGFLGTGSPITGLNASIVAAGSIKTTATTNPNSATYSDWLSMTTAIHSAALANAKWYFNRAQLGLAFGLLDLSNRPIFNPEIVWNTKQFMGFPFELVEVLAGSSVSAATPIAFFGDLKMAATFAEREAYNMMFSDVATVGGNSAFEKNLFFYRFEESYDIEIEQPLAMAKLMTHA